MGACLASLLPFHSAPGFESVSVFLTKQHPISGNERERSGSDEEEGTEEISSEGCSGKVAYVRIRL